MVDPRIVEVYGDQLETLVLNDKDRMNGLNDFLQKRVKIIYEEFNSGEKYTKLSEVKLFNSYNNELVRDEVFEPNTFNALKYDFPIFSGKYEVRKYRVDNTNYIIKILTPNFKDN